MANTGKLLIRAGEAISKLPKFPVRWKEEYLYPSLKIGGVLGVLRGAYGEGLELRGANEGYQLSKWTLIGATWPLSLPALLAFRMGRGLDPCQKK